VITEADVRAALPTDGFLKDYVEYAERCSDSPLAFQLQGGLIVLTQTLPDELSFPQGGIPLHGNLFALSVGQSTKARKSHGVARSQNLLTASGFEPTEVPGSAEGLLESLRLKEHTAFFYEEFGTFLAQSERGYLNPIRTLYTQIYDSRPLGRALAKAHRGVIKKPRVSLFGGVTVDFLEQYTGPEDWTGGFMARFFTMYANNERDYSRQPAADVGRQILIDKIQLLMSLDTLVGECLGLHQSTHTLWDEWYYALNKRVEESAQATRAAIHRAPGMAYKIALLLAWDRGAARAGVPWFITEENLAVALKLTDLHVESVLEIGDRLAPNRDLRDMNAVLFCFDSAKPLTEGEIISKSKVGLKRRVREVIETLCARGLIVHFKNGNTDLFAKTAPKNGANGQVISLFQQQVEGIDLDAIDLEATEATSSTDDVTELE